MAGSTQRLDHSGGPRRETRTSHRRIHPVVRLRKNGFRGSCIRSGSAFQDAKPNGYSTMQRALNSLLPPDIGIRKVEEVDENFHARMHSKSKVYEYRILNRNLRSVFHREYLWYIPQKLNFTEMKKATQSLIGEHDFSAFRSVGSPTRTTVRRVPGRVEEATRWLPPLRDRSQWLFESRW